MNDKCVALCDHTSQKQGPGEHQTRKICTLSCASSPRSAGCGGTRRWRPRLAPQSCTKKSRAGKDVHTPSLARDDVHGMRETQARKPAASRRQAAPQQRLSRSAPPLRPCLMEGDRMGQTIFQAIILPIFNAANLPDGRGQDGVPGNEVHQHVPAFQQSSQLVRVLWRAVDVCGAGAGQKGRVGWCFGV